VFLEHDSRFFGQTRPPILLHRSAAG